MIVFQSGVRSINGTPISEKGIADLLKNTVSTPSLGRIDDSDDFRISLTGAQEKTALLRSEGKWMRPHGATPTTHILKLPLGKAVQGIDLQTSVENEWLCSQILSAYGVPAAHCWMDKFGDQKVLVVERFDRRMARGQRWIVCCRRRISVRPPGTDRNQKYEADGGPGIEKIMDVLFRLRTARAGQVGFSFVLKSYSGCSVPSTEHAKNFSIFLHAGGQYQLTPR